MTSTLTPPRTTPRMHTLTPYLAVVDARASIAFYVAAFGAMRRGDPHVMPDGRIGHVEVGIGDTVLMLADEFPEIGLRAPVGRGGASQSLRLETADPDGVVAAAVAAGAVLERPVTDAPYGRGGVVVDPDGHRWMVSREAPTAHRRRRRVRVAVGARRGPHPAVLRRGAGRARRVGHRGRGHGRPSCAATR